MCKNTHAFINFASCLQHFHHLFKKAIDSHLLKLNHSNLEQPSADLSKTMTAIFGVAQQNNMGVVCLESPYYPLEYFDMKRRDEVLITFLTNAFMYPVA